MKPYLQCILLLATAATAAYPGPIKPGIDKFSRGMPDVLRYNDGVPVYPGTRCGENFGLPEPRVKTDALLCVGKPKGDAKEQDGDSGGPVFTEINGVRVQIGVNTGTYAADENRNKDTPADTHIGYYTAINWNTIKPWLSKILAGDISGAKSMTCADLGGKTAPKPSSRRLKEVEAAADMPYHRRLISGVTTQASKGQFPSLTIMMQQINDNGILKPDVGCDGTLIARNVMLTAAHCFTNTEMTAAKNQLRAWPGAYNLTDVNTQEFRFAQEVIRHPCFKITNYPACLESECQDTTKPMEDIAVAILASDANASAVITPVLGQGAYASTTLSFPVTGTIAGFGRYCDPMADNDASKCTMKDYNQTNDVPESVDSYACAMSFPSGAILVSIAVFLISSESMLI